MRLLVLALQAAAVILVTTAAPLPQPPDIVNISITAEPDLFDTAILDPHVHNNERRDPNKKRPKGEPNGRSKSQAVGKTTTSTKPTRKGPSTGTSATSPEGLALLSKINSFDMAVKVKMVSPPASGTNSITASVVEEVLRKAAGVPKTSKDPIASPKLGLRSGSFQAVVKKNWLRVKDAARQASAVALLQSASAAKKQYTTRPISGELDLTHVISQGLVAPATEVLAAIGHPHAYWFGVGRGGAPIPDLQLNVGNIPRAVVEIKTTHSMPNSVADMIFDDFDKFTMDMLPDKFKSDDTAKVNSDDTAKVVERGEKKAPKRVPSLVHPRDKDVQYRDDRRKPAKILEQLFTQMWSTGAMLGAITNLETWLIVERSGVADFSITKVPGMLADGRSNGLNVMLAMSSHVLAK